MDAMIQSPPVRGDMIRIRSRPGSAAPSDSGAGSAGAGSPGNVHADAAIRAPSEKSGKMKFLRTMEAVILWFLIFPAFPSV